MLSSLRRVVSHVIIYAAVSAFLVAVWVLVGGGSYDELVAVVEQPGQAMSMGFWPVWPILVWGTVVVIHAGLAIPNALFGPKARRRRAKVAREIVSAIDGAHRRHGPRPNVMPPPSDGPSRRWVTVMFCDIVGSTSHNERLGDEEWHRVLAHVRGIVRSALVERGGEEVGTQGDGMLSRFRSPADAVLCGIDVQSELGAARSDSRFVPEVRIGVHAGDAVEDEGDLVGRVINLASRVTDEAAPGEILVTEPVADQLVGHLELEDRGLRPLKGLQQPRHLLAVRWSDEAQD